MRGDGRIFKRGQRWWIAYYVRGKEYRESAGRTEAEAKRRLRTRLNEIHGDRFVTPREARLTVDELLDGLITHLEMRRVKSLGAIQSHLKPVREGLGHLRAVDLSPAIVESFMRDRLEEGKAPATVNREVQPLKQAYNLARRQGQVPRAPYIRLLKEDNVRQGFFEHEEFEAVVEHLAEPLSDITRFAYLSGWRKGEILGLRWAFVDRKGKEIRLPTSKSGYGRVLPLDGILWQLVERRWVARKFASTSGGTTLSEYVFHREGKPIVDFKRAWSSACERAGVAGRLFHDLRRTAVRNMIRAGVPQSVAMSITGHRTISTFIRYNITSIEDMREAIHRTVAAHAMPNGQNPTDRPWPCS